MVIDSLFQKRSQNLLIYLQMYPPALPPQNETANSGPDLKLFQKVGFQVKVTFWFWLMYPPPPPNEKVGFQVKVKFWFWLMPPPPPDNGIGLNMNAIEKIISSEVIKYILQSTPTSSTLSDFMHAQENCEFQLQMDI